MRFTPFSQRTKFLRIDVQPSWPASLPPCVWGEIQLSSFTAEAPQQVLEFDTKNQALEDVLFDLYPRLSLMSFAELLDQLQALNVKVRVGKWAARYGWRESEDFRRTLVILQSLPRAFQVWAAEKDLGANDVAPLRAVSNLDLLTPYLLTLVEGGPSRSDGVRALEWLVDVHLGGGFLNEIFGEARSFAEKKAALYRARHPDASARDERQQALAKKLPWPKRAQVRSTRSGDQSGFEVKLFVRSPEELHQQIRGLEAVATTYDVEGRDEQL